MKPIWDQFKTNWNQFELKSKKIEINWNLFEINSKSIVNKFNNSNQIEINWHQFEINWNQFNINSKWNWTQLEIKSKSNEIHLIPIQNQLKSIEINLKPIQHQLKLCSNILFRTPTTQISTLFRHQKLFGKISHTNQDPTLLYMPSCYCKAVWYWSQHHFRRRWTGIKCNTHTHTLDKKWSFIGSVGNWIPYMHNPTRPRTKGVLYEVIIEISV